MKKILTILILAGGIGGSAFAQTPSSVDFATLQTDLSSYLQNSVAPSIPFGSTMGLNWSSAWVGQLLHFGIGVSGGAVFVPIGGIDSVYQSFTGSSLPSELNYPGLGLPLPAYTVEGRLGGIILPFDIGFKYGTIPQTADLTSVLGTGNSVQFHLYGIEARYLLAKERFLIPQISFGVGYDHFDGNVSSSIASIPINNFSISGDPNSPYSVSFTNPGVALRWDSNIVDAKLEISKTILYIVTPYIGAGVYYGSSNVGGGVAGTVTVKDKNGNTVSPSQLDSLAASYQQATGQTVDFGTLQNPGFFVTGNWQGFGAHVFVGTSVNLLILKVDATVMYDVFSQQLGVTLGTRLQF